MINERSLLWTKPVAAGLLLISLAGCVETTPPIPTKPLSSGVEVEIRNSVLATFISASCPQKFTTDKVAMNKLNLRVRKEVLGQGIVNPSDQTVAAILDKTVSKKEFQDTVFEYARSRDISISEPSSWCMAGLAEVKRKTEVGKYLAPKG